VRRRLHGGAGERLARLIAGGAAAAKARARRTLSQRQTRPKLSVQAGLHLRRALQILVGERQVPLARSFGECPSRGLPFARCLASQEMNAWEHAATLPQFLLMLFHNETRRRASFIVR
jgi:hypothetical protein